MGTLLRKHSNAAQRLTGLLVSIGILLSMLPGMPEMPSVLAADGDQTETVTQTRLENGSFEVPAVDPDKDLTDSDMAGGKYWFLKPRTQVEQIAQNRHGTGFYWDTTAYNDGIGTGKIELVYPTNRTQYGGITNTADGDQFAELCAKDQASLYQNVRTEPGAVYHWRLSHAARNKAENPAEDKYNGTETMALFIGAKQSASLYKKGPGIGDNNDIFMWMARLLKETERIHIEVDNTTTKEDIQEGMTALTVYSKDNIDVSSDNLSTDENNANYYQNYFSLTPNTEKGITKEWKCWIITTRKDSGWVQQTGSYEIPANQTETTFAFTALTGKKNQEGDVINEGNLLDDIAFEKEYPLRVTTTAGGTGRVYSTFDPDTFKPTDPEDATHQQVIAGEEVISSDPNNGGKPHDHFRRYNDGTQLTVYAAPEDGYKFIGAYIDGAFHAAPSGKDPNEYFTPVMIGSIDGWKPIYAYYSSIIMNKARYVQLIYTKEYAVIFDPNGGYYNETQENTEIKTADQSKWVNGIYTSRAATSGKTADTPEVKFVGWYTASLPSYYDENDKPSTEKGALVDGKVEIKFTNAYSEYLDKFTSTYQYAYVNTSGTHTDDTKANAGMTFIAQWEYLQKARAMTMTETALGYANSMTGGTVEITKMQGAESEVTGRTINTYDDDGVEVTSGGGAVSKGYARMKDNIELTAIPKTGYVFVGWYDDTDPNNVQLISEHSTVYGYELGQGARSFQARFRAVLQYPYLSFVSQEETPDTTEQPFDEGTSLRVGTNKVENYTARQDGGIGGRKYGNTISTGFSTMQTINNIAYDRCLWTITIPAVPGEDPLYIKSNTELKADMKATEILPNDNAARNPGAIYKVGSFDKQEIKLRSMLPEISGEGQIVFAVILDNIYAPGAYATLDLKTQADDKVDATQLDDNNSYSYSTSNGAYNYYDHISSQTTNIP